jgi:hypothetical protein
VGAPFCDTNYVTELRLAVNTVTGASSRSREMRTIRTHRERPSGRRAAEKRERCAASFNYLVGAGGEPGRYVKSERLGGLEVDD